ncbi:ABC transporter ATP-binding protein [Planosporangium thailandense]|uniref:Spermidine/putrescine import ATP-binding protein PotA n=1 Tax=Planosporangium thailandense TaxID=765197 RepID=A0ABX0Y6C3_9ACTN|nr:ABC transporter ATP-binding protein [Planosporangium thailandense]NJC73937.1 ABC transporter ATP-binding protein [Planosporangium thailandense]
MSAHGASITLKGLTKRYGTATAVDAIDLEARPGEFLTLLGPSGSGKTTTLNMIAGFVDVTSGELLIDDRPVHSLPPHKRNIGMVFQHYALFPHMSVSENVAYPLRQRKVPKAERQALVTEALRTVGLAHLGHRRPQQLSGGQQQRVALARAMVYSPRVLLMDEPLGALDKKLRDSLQLEIKRIHGELGTTFVYVTHDQDEALVLSDRIAVFNDGRIEQVGTAEDLYERPSTLFVAQFLGESSLFHGVATEGADGAGVRALDRTLRAGRGHARAGEPAALVVRPERIRVHPIDGAAADQAGVDQSAPAGNAVRGRVRQEIYLGNSRKLAVEVADGTQVLVRESAGDLSGSRPGDEVWLTFRPEDAAVLPATPSHDNTPTRTAN